MLPYFWMHSQDCSPLLDNIYLVKNYNICTSASGPDPLSLVSQCQASLRSWCLWPSGMFWLLYPAALCLSLYTIVKCLKTGIRYFLFGSRSPITLSGPVANSIIQGLVNWTVFMRLNWIKRINFCFYESIYSKQISEVKPDLSKEPHRVTGTI